VGITRVVYPGYGSTRLMRVMQTNACSLSCGYCPTFCGGKVRRTYLAPEEVSRVFMDAHRSGLADGLFLTSGVPGRPAKMTDRMLAAVDLLRRREGFRGYVHLKLLPGAESAQVEAAVRLASRVSINLEAPGDGYVRALARDKDFGGDLLPKLELAGRLALERRRLDSPAQPRVIGPTTQFVVGAAGEADREILGLVARLDAITTSPRARLQPLPPPTPAQRTAMQVVDPDDLPFDPETTEADGAAGLLDPTDEYAQRRRVPVIAAAALGGVGTAVLAGLAARYVRRRARSG